MHSKQLKHFKPLNPDSKGSCDGGGERKGVGGVLRESDGVGGRSVEENTRGGRVSSPLGYDKCHMS